MSRDLGGEVEKLMKSTNPYVKKKVQNKHHRLPIESMCICRLFSVLFASYEKFPNNSMCSKIPFEVYSVTKITVRRPHDPKKRPRLFSLSAGVLLTATALVTEMCQQNSQALQIFRKVCPHQFCTFSLRPRFYLVSVSTQSCSYPQKFDHVRLQS